MNDVVSINRLFLIMAREAAKTKSGEVITGLPKSVLERLGRLSLVEIEELAQEAGLSLINFRLNEDELERLIALHNDQRSAYALSVATASQP